MTDSPTSPTLNSPPKEVPSDESRGREGRRARLSGDPPEVYTFVHEDRKDRDKKVHRKDRDRDRDQEDRNRNRNRIDGDLGQCHAFAWLDPACLSGNPPRRSPLEGENQIGEDPIGEDRDRDEEDRDRNRDRNRDRDREDRKDRKDQKDQKDQEDQDLILQDQEDRKDQEDQEQVERVERAKRLVIGEVLKGRGLKRRGRRKKTEIEGTLQMKFPEIGLRSLFEPRRSPCSRIDLNRLLRQTGDWIREGRERTPNERSRYEKSLETRIGQLEAALRRLGPAEFRQCDYCAGVEGFEELSLSPRRARTSLGEIRDLERRLKIRRDWQKAGCRSCGRLRKGAPEIQEEEEEEEIHERTCEKALDVRRSLLEDRSRTQRCLEEQSEARRYWSEELGIFLPPNWTEWYGPESDASEDDGGDEADDDDGDSEDDSDGRLGEIVDLMRGHRLWRRAAPRLLLRWRLRKFREEQRKGRHG